MKNSRSMANLTRRSSGPGTRSLMTAIGASVKSLADRSAHGGNAYDR